MECPRCGAPAVPGRRPDDTYPPQEGATGRRHDSDPAIAIREFGQSTPS
jgi:hypothetical protein